MPLAASSRVREPVERTKQRRRQTHHPERHGAPPASVRRGVCPRACPETFRFLHSNACGDARAQEAERDRPREHRVEHRRRQPPGLRVLLAHVVRAEQLRRALERHLRAVRESRRGPRDHHTPGAQHAEHRRPGDRAEREHHPRPQQLQLPGQPRRSSAPARPDAACWPAARTGRRASPTLPGGGDRRPATRSGPDWPARPGAAPRRGSHPERSPVKTRPVRFPPCAAGARPTIVSRARGSPHPGTGRAQYVHSRNARRFTRPTSSRQRTSRGQATHLGMHSSSPSSVSQPRRHRGGPPHRLGDARPTGRSSALPGETSADARPRARLQRTRRYSNNARTPRERQHEDSATCGVAETYSESLKLL